MSQQRWLWLAIATIMSPITLHAGQIYGSISSGGRAVQNAAIEINCGGNATPGATVGDGAYRINVPQQGQCTLTLTGVAGRPSAVGISRDR